MTAQLTRTSADTDQDRRCRRLDRLRLAMIAALAVQLLLGMANNLWLTQTKPNLDHASPPSLLSAHTTWAYVLIVLAVWTLVDAARLRRRPYLAPAVSFAGQATSGGAARRSHSELLLVGLADQGPARVRQRLHGEGEQVGVFDLGVAEKLTEQFPQLAGILDDIGAAEAAENPAVFANQAVDLLGALGGLAQLGEEPRLFHPGVLVEQPGQLGDEGAG